MITKSDFKVTSAWDSHRPLLWIALNEVEGKVIELGAGLGSTELLNKYCEENGRLFSSYESNAAWHKERQPEIHAPIHLISSYDDVRVIECGIILIDNAPGERRKIDIQRWQFKAQVILVHDSEPAAEHVYNLADEFKKFRFKCDLKTDNGHPWSTVVSNYIDVTKWKGIRLGEYYID